MWGAEFVVPKRASCYVIYTAWDWVWEPFFLSSHFYHVTRQIYYFFLSMQVSNDFFYFLFPFSRHLLNSTVPQVHHTIQKRIKGDPVLVVVAFVSHLI